MLSRKGRAPGPPLRFCWVWRRRARARPGARDSLLARRGPRGDPRRDRRRGDARDRARALALPSGPGLARLRRSRRAHAEEGRRRGPVGRGDRALPRGRKDEVRPLPRVLRLGPGVRGSRGGLADAATASPRSRISPWLSPTTARTADVTAPLVDVGAGTQARGLRGQGRPRQARARRRRPPDGPPPRLPRAGRGRLPFRLPQPDDAVVRRRPRPRPLGPPRRRTSSGTASRSWCPSARPRTSARGSPRGRTIVLAARVDAKMVPATYDVVVATIPGTDPASGEVVLTAHLCHQSAGANDNASGSAAILEVGRALAAAIRRGTLPPPKRTIRFLWLPEIAGSQVYLVRHPELVSRHGGRQSTWTWSAACSRRRRAPSTSRARRSRCPTSSIRSPRPGSPRSRRRPCATRRPRRRRLRRLRLAPGLARAASRRRARDRDGQRPRGLRGGELRGSRWSTSTTSPTSRSTPRRTCPRTSTRRSSAASPTWGPGSPGPSRPCPTRRRRPCSP